MGTCQEMPVLSRIHLQRTCLQLLVAVIAAISPAAAISIPTDIYLYLLQPTVL